MSCARAAYAIAALALGLSAAGCGGSDSALQQTADNLADIHSGALRLRLGLVPTGSSGVSVELRGPFALTSETPLPVADIDYEQRAGRLARATFTSTGRRAFVTTGRRTVRLTRGQLAGLRVGAGDTKSLDDLGLHVERWIDDAKTASGPRLDGTPTQRITGKLNAAEALGDLARAAGQTGLSGDEVKRLARTVSASSVEILTGKQDHLLRRLRLAVALSVPPELRSRTGGKSGLTVKVDFSLRDVNRPVRVEPPPGA